MRAYETMSGGAPLWAALSRVPAQYPWLSEDTECDVCVVGGGITGVLCTLRLAEQGENVVLITAGQIGFGSTAATMPCVEYDCGQTVRRLAKRAGHDAALRMLELGAAALDELEELCKTLDGDCGFARRDALLFTDDESELDMLGREYAERRRAGVDCTFISRAAAKDVFAFEVAGGIMSKGMAAELDPYRLTQLCARRAQSLGARIFENTRANRIDHILERDRSEITTSTYRKVTAKKVVVAAGEACADILDGLAAPRTFFTVLSHRVRRLSGWPGRCIIRSFSAPHVTFAATQDGRICASGLATSVVDEHARLGGVFHMPRLHQRRFEELEAGARYLFPAIETPQFEYAQAWRSCSSIDGLPVIGLATDCPECWFAVCCGSGGILMSEAASRMIGDMCAGRRAADEELFSPERRSLS